MGADGVNATSTSPEPRTLTSPTTGVCGTSAVTLNDCVSDAARWLASPSWCTVTVQVPALAKASTPAAVTVHTAGVEETKRSGRPESTEATSVGVVPNACAPGLAKVMTWVTAVVTALEAADEVPVPTLLLAVTVKVYAVPVSSPLTVIGEPLPVVGPPATAGLGVTV